jgi:two-component system, NarL family, response regulator
MVQRGERVIPAAVAIRLAEFPERSDLTEREVEVLQLVGRGLSNKEAAQAVGRTEAVTVALARGLIHLE